MIRLAIFLNKFLAIFNVAICKRSTLDNLYSYRDGSDSEIRVNIAELKDNIDTLKTEIIQHQTFTRWSQFDDFRHFLKYQNDSLRCPLCGYKDDISCFTVFQSSCIFQGGDLIRYQCPNCDLIFGDQKMLALSKEGLGHDYEWHYRIYSEGDSSVQEIKAFHMLKPQRDGVYLNYGAGSWSNSVEKLRDEGWNVWAYEPHESATTAGRNYIIKSKEELLNMKFDGIYSNNVLEHLRYPIKDFKFMSGLLKDDALMSHATPCFEYLYEYTRFHFFFYLGRSREILAEKSGLIIEDYVQDDHFMCTTYKRKK